MFNICAELCEWEKDTKIYSHKPAVQKNAALIEHEKSVDFYYHKMDLYTKNAKFIPANISFTVFEFIGCTHKSVVWNLSQSCLMIQGKNVPLMKDHPSYAATLPTWLEHTDNQKTVVAIFQKERLWSLHPSPLQHTHVSPYCLDEF